MTVLHRRRPDAPSAGSTMLSQADGLLAGEGRRERVRSAVRTVQAMVGGACSGMTAGILLGIADLAQVQPVAGALAGIVATLAVKVSQDRAQRVRVAVLDIPGGRDLSEKLLGMLDHAPVATRKGAAWVVFDRVDSPPRVLSERDYVRFASNVPSIIEIDATKASLFLTRLTYGRSDSVLTGLPAIEAFDHAGVRYATEWHVDGEKVNRAAVMRARALGEPEPSYEEETFQPRI